MKILVTGVNGQLGTAVIARAKQLGLDVTGVDREDFDISSAAQTAAYFAEYKPDAVIHCAAYTAVDKAENDYDACFEANCTGTLNIARECGNIGAKLIYISTDYVFDGNGGAPYDVDSETNPLSVYGKSKLAGEAAVSSLCKKHFIVRTSWVFGCGNNFIKTMLRLCTQKPYISVVADQTGSPTYAEDLAVLLCDILVTEKYGTYHATNEGDCSWFELACEVLSLVGSETPVIPVTTEDYHTAAKRPLDSRLSKSSLDKAGFKRLPNWHDAVKRYVGTLYAPTEK